MRKGRGAAGAGRGVGMMGGRTEGEVDMRRTVGEVAAYLGAAVRGDAGVMIDGVAAPDRAEPTDLIYVDAAKHMERAAASRAVCVIAAPGMELAEKTIVEAAQPKLAFAKAATWLLGRERGGAWAPAGAGGGIHATAIVDPSARIAAAATVGPYAVIEADAEVDTGCEIGAFCFVGRGARMGDGCRLHPRVTVYAGVVLGKRVEVHAGTVIGGDGFGYVWGEGRHWKFPQIGGVEIGDDVEIGCNTTIDRGSLETTRIGADVKIDNLVQVAHNVEIGEHSIVAAQTGISGSSVLGRNVVVGGQVGIADHCTLEDGAIAGAQAGIPTGKTIRKGQMVWGTPARPIEKFKEQYAWFGRLAELGERVRKLEERAKGASTDEHR